MKPVEIIAAIENWELDFRFHVCDKIEDRNIYKCIIFAQHATNEGRGFSFDVAFENAFTKFMKGQNTIENKSI